MSERQARHCVATTVTRRVGRRVVTHEEGSTAGSTEPSRYLVKCLGYPHSAPRMARARACILPHHRHTPPTRHGTTLQTLHCVWPRPRIQAVALSRGTWGGGPRLLGEGCLFRCARSVPATTRQCPGHAPFLPHAHSACHGRCFDGPASCVGAPRLPRAGPSLYGGRYVSPRYVRRRQALEAQHAPHMPSTGSRPCGASACARNPMLRRHTPPPRRLSRRAPRALWIAG